MIFAEYHDFLQIPTVFRFYSFEGDFYASSCIILHLLKSRVFGKNPYNLYGILPTIHKKTPEGLYMVYIDGLFSIRV